MGAWVLTHPPWGTRGEDEVRLGLWAGCRHEERHRGFYRLIMKLCTIISFEDRCHYYGDSFRFQLKYLFLHNDDPPFKVAPTFYLTSSKPSPSIGSSFAFTF